MILSEDDLLEYCHFISNNSTTSKSIILCEGEVPYFKGKNTIKAFKNSEHLQDSAFYKNCVPGSPKQKKLLFFNCGGSADVIKIFYRLKELYAKNPGDCRFNPEKVFALIDADLQDLDFSLFGYEIKNRYSLYEQLYAAGNLNDIDFKKHKIFLTGLIHKEAYFLLPENQNLFDEFRIQSMFRGKKLQLSDIYKDLIDETGNDKDLSKNFEKVKDRISHTNFDVSSIENLQKSWEKKFKEVLNDVDTENLAKSILTLRKVKIKIKNEVQDEYENKFWKEIMPDSDMIQERFLEQLSLEIAVKIRNSEPTPKNHISYFFRLLSQTN
jgi:hypothetical protein